jgi:hypothetical protein
MRLTPALLSTAAALAMASTAASAADLPTKKAAPVEYVRVCSVHGAGFWYIPGTETCIKLGGRVRAEYGYLQPLSYPIGNLYTAPLSISYTAPGGAFYSYYGAARGYGRDVDASGFQANGRLDVDVRTTTEWGTLRAFFRYDFYRESGPYDGLSNAGACNYPGSCGNGLDKAYIQWNGLTAGRATSFFDFYGNDFLFGSLAGSDHTTNLFAYSFRFGSGFSATLSAEDSTDSNKNWVAADWVYGYAGPDSNYSQLPYAYPYAIGSALRGGTRVPDLVANLRVDQGWGSAQLSGAIHQNRFSSATGFLNSGTLSENSYSAYASEKWGWAVQAGVKLNVPYFAAGDTFYLQAAYSSGASTYSIGGGVSSLGFAQGFAGDGILYPTYSYNGVNNAYQSGWTAENTNIWTALAAFKHYWSPTLRSEFGVSYTNVENKSGTAIGDFGYGFSTTNPAAGTAFSTASFGPDNVKIWQAAANVIWSPVSGLDIGAEVGYAHVDAGFTPYAQIEYAPASGSGYSYLANKSTQDRFYTRLRVQREF